MADPQNQRQCDLEEIMGYGAQLVLNASTPRVSFESSIDICGDQI
ncbi:Protein of unknown function [Pyronema omphalodes CBS 100304]|uniref:Uncharacterized protein n=1 Tax=Pyronema omphalodes (strain CBS 100304) TaxID=1076935 RepID=U4KUW1_PYROM|nr:Protein of unknown function [Pyronema omphalodes CBS 100304]